MTDTREAGVDPEADVVRSEMEVRALEGTRQRALIDRDMETLEQIFAEDLVHIHTNGLVHDRLALLSHIESRNQFLDVQRPMLRVRVYGDLAVLDGPLLNFMRNPDRVMEAYATQVARRTDTWRFVSFHACLQTT